MKTFLYLKLFSIPSFDPEQDRWVPVASMRSKRLAVGVAVVNRLVGFYTVVKALIYKLFVFEALCYRWIRWRTQTSNNGMLPP